MPKDNAMPSDPKTISPNRAERRRRARGKRRAAYGPAQPTASWNGRIGWAVEAHFGVTQDDNLTSVAILLDPAHDGLDEERVVRMMRGAAVEVAASGWRTGCLHPCGLTAIIFPVQRPIAWWRNPNGQRVAQLPEGVLVVFEGNPRWFGSLLTSLWESLGTKGVRPTIGTEGPWFQFVARGRDVGADA